MTDATAAAAGNFVDRGGAKIWYEECGAGDNEVLLHGSVKTDFSFSGATAHTFAKSASNRFCYSLDILRATDWS